MNRKKLALLIILIIFVLTVVWSFMSFPRYKTVSPAAPAPGNKQTVIRPRPAPSAATVKMAAKPSTTSDERVLKLDLLEREQSGFKGYRRNIFKPVFEDEIKMMKQKAVAFKPLPVPPVAVAVQKPVVPVAPVAPVVQPETHQSTLAQFTFLGFLKKDNKKTIFLSKDKEIVLVRNGESFAKRYQATSITDQALTIKVTDTGEEIVIPLTENKRLSPQVK
jgi:hypothetical protein